MKNTLPFSSVPEAAKLVCNRDVLVCNRNTMMADMNFNTMQQSLFYKILLQYSDCQTAALNCLQNGEIEFPDTIKTSFEVDITEFGHDYKRNFESLMEMLSLVVHLPFNVDKSERDGLHAPLLGAVRPKEDGDMVLCGKDLVSKRQIVVINQNILPYLIYTGKAYRRYEIETIGRVAINYRELSKIKGNYSKKLYCLVMSHIFCEGGEFPCAIGFVYAPLLRSLGISRNNADSRPKMFIKAILEPFAKSVLMNTGLLVDFEYRDSKNKVITPPFSTGKGGTNLNKIYIRIKDSELRSASSNKFAMILKWINKKSVQSAFGDNLWRIFQNKDAMDALYKDICGLEEKMVATPKEFPENKVVNCLKKTISSILSDRSAGQ